MKADSIWEIDEDERRRLEKAIATGDEAQRVLDSPLLRLAFDARKIDIHREWERTPPTDVDALTALKYEVDAINSVQRKLTKHVDTAKKAVHALEQAGEGA